MRKGSSPTPPLRRMREALRLIAGTHCSSSTLGPGSCITSYRTKDAYYTADRWCDQCIAFYGLGKKARREK